MYQTEFSKKIDKKLFKKNMNKLARTLIGYTAMMFVVMFVYIIYITIKTLINYSEDIDKGFEYLDSYVSKLENNGVIYIVGIAIGMLIIILYCKKQAFPYKLTTVRKKMDLKKFMILFVCFMGPQAVFSMAGFLAEKLLNSYGYSMLKDMQSASSVSSTISMFLYASFLGPIAEEVVFRGVVLRKLEPYGRVFAIVVSSILFGAFHGNLIQGIFASIVGLVLGYVAIEYSIKWSMIIHIINNFLFSDVMERVLQNVSETSSVIITNTITGAFFIGACIIVYKNRLKVKQYIDNNRTHKKLYLNLFMSSWMIIYLLGNLLLAIGGIERISG